MWHRRGPTPCSLHVWLTGMASSASDEDALDIVEGDRVTSPDISVRREVVSLQRDDPARQLSFWPVAIGVAVEVTKLSEPSMERVASATPRVGGP